MRPEVGTFALERNCHVWALSQNSFDLLLPLLVQATNDVGAPVDETFNLGRVSL